MRWLCIGLVVIGLLAGCDTSDQPTDMPFYTATAPVPRPAATAVGEIDFDLQGGNPESVLSPGAFHIAVSGDVISDTGSGGIVYNYVPPSGSVSERDKIFITTTDATASQQISFEFMPGLQPGTYPLVDPGLLIPGRVTTQYLRLSDDGTGQSRIQAYNQNLQGTLVLLETGAAISGVFEFTAEWITGDTSGATVHRAVTVRGEFTDVPYMRRADPFENDVPLPPRATLEPNSGGG